MNEAPSLAVGSFVVIGPLASLSRRQATIEVARCGGVLRRGLTRQTRYVVVGYGAIRLVASGALERLINRAEAVGAEVWSERAFRRWLGLAPPHPCVERPFSAADVTRNAGLSDSLLRWLVMFDALDPQEARFSFQDVTAARQLARLLARRVPLDRLLASAIELIRDGAAEQVIHLVPTASGDVARRFGACIGDLHGQLSLPMDEPDNPSADRLFEAAEDAEEAGDLARAEILYRRCLDRDRSDSVTAYNLAGVLRKNGQDRAARFYLRLAVACDPAFSEAWYNLAHLALAAGNRRAARKHLEQAIAADPHYADALYNLAILAFQEDDFRASASLCRRYLAADPNSPWARTARARLTLCAHILRTSEAPEDCVKRPLPDCG
jgi:tetratricopeptide (TPR) repeat protein